MRLEISIKATDFVTKGNGKLTITYTPEDGSAPQSFEVYNFKGDGVALAMYNTNESITQRICTFLL